MAFCMFIGIITTLLSHEPRILRDPETIIALTKRTRTLKGLIRALRNSFCNTFDYLKQREDWFVLLAYILFFKLADTALNVMATPFLLELGFSKLEIAHVGKSFGIGAMIAGGLLAGVLLSQRPLREMLFLCATLQFVSALLFLLQSVLGHNIYVLIGTIGIENFSNGMGAAAFITYLSHVCRNGGHAGTHFAFLTSIASLARVGFSYGAGIGADLLPWSSYYAITALLCLPNCILILWASRSFLYPSHLPQPRVS